MNELMAALTDCADWLKGFTRRSYETTFRKYQACFEESYLRAVETCGAEGIPALVEDLLDELEAQWKTVRFWNRSAAKTDTKQVIIFYLTPMLLEQEALRPLAAALRDGWNRRWPDNSYHAASFERIRSGFKNVILGIEIPERKEKKPVEDDV